MKARAATLGVPLLWPVGFGVLIGATSFAVAQMGWAWMGFVVSGLAFVTLLVAARDVERLLIATLVLSMQADAEYRLFYDRAGSEGLALPLSVLLGVALVFWYMVGDGRNRLRTSVFAGTLGLPIAAMLATSVLAWSVTSERFVGLGRLLFEFQLYFIYWIALNIVRSEADFERVVKLLFVCLAMQSVIYFLQAQMGMTFTLEGDVIPTGEVPRPGGTVSTNPAGFASFIVPILLIALTRILSTRRRGEAGYLAGLVVLGCVAVGLTVTRAAWAGFAIGVLWVLVLGAHRGSLRMSRVAAILATVAVVAVFIMPRMEAREDEGSVADAYAEREGLMRIAEEIIAAHPLAGIGPGAYQYLYKAYLPTDLPRQWLYTVHNEYLLRAAETGIPGGIAFVVLLLAAFGVALRLSRAAQPSFRSVGIAWGGGLLALAWQMYWVPWRGFEYNALLWFMMGLSEAGVRLSAVPTVREGESPR